MVNQQEMEEVYEEVINSPKAAGALDRSQYRRLLEEAVEEPVEDDSEDRLI